MTNQEHITDLLEQRKALQARIHYYIAEDRHQAAETAERGVAAIDAILVELLKNERDGNKIPDVIVTEKEPKKEKTLSLEENNFKVERTKEWKKITSPNGVEVYESPTKDIWEYADGELEGEQLFTWDAAMRETEKAGKRMPTDEEFNEIVKSKSDVANLKYSGFRNTTGNYYNRTTNGYLWSSTQSGSSNAWTSYFNYSMVSVGRNTPTKAYGFSVRCIK